MSSKYHNAIRKVTYALASREQVAMALDAIGMEEMEIDHLLDTEWPELLGRLEGMPDPMEIWRTLSPGPVHDELGTYWSWAKEGAIEHAQREVGDHIILLHGEVEKRHVDWPRTFANSLGSYDWEKEIFIPSGAPIRLLDVDGEPDGRILTA